MPLGIEHYFKLNASIIKTVTFHEANMYITNANLKRLIESIDSAEIDTKELNIKSEVINDILSDEELEDLKHAKAFFLGRSFNISELRPIEIIDQMRYLNEGHKPAYHYNEDCQKAKMHFDDYIIPDIIRLKGPAEVARYRIRAKGLELSNMEHCLILAAEFGVSPELIYQKKFEKNRGVDSFTLQDLSYLQGLTSQQLDEELEKVSKALIEFLNASSLHRDLYNLRFRKYSFIRWVMKGRDEDTVNLANELANHKQLAIAIIEQKAKKESNFDQSGIEERLLVHLNFVPCRTCI